MKEYHVAGYLTTGPSVKLAGDLKFSRRSELGQYCVLLCRREYVLVTSSRN